MIKTIVEDAIPEFSFPFLGKSKHGEVVLFTKGGFGTLIVACHKFDRDVGYVTHEWNMENFTFIPGLKVTLENT